MVGRELIPSTTGGSPSHEEAVIAAAAEPVAAAPAAPAPAEAAPSPAPAPAPAAAAPAAPEPPEYVAKLPLGKSPAKGPANAPITIVEFSDFQCPFCSKVNPTIKQIETEYKGKVLFAFKHLPIKFHDKAQLAAEASMAAHEQGKFWEYHDKLFANPEGLDRASLERYAAELKLDLKKFTAALDSGKHKAQIDADLKLADESKTTSTPTFFVNGRRLVGTQPYDAFRMVIEQELAKKKKS